MNTKKYALYLTIFLFVSLVFLTLNVHATSTTSFYWSPNVKFKLTAYNTVIGFDDYATFNSFTWQYPTAKTITFHNILLGSGTALSALNISNPDTNLTLSTVNSEKVELTTSDVSATVMFYAPTPDIKGVQIGESTYTENNFYTDYQEWQDASEDAIFQNSTLTAVKTMSSTSVLATFISFAENTPTSYHVIFPAGSSLQFQNDINKTVQLHVLSGVLNSTTNTISIDKEGGFFRFTALNDTQIKISFEGINVVGVSGDQGNERRVIASGTVITVNKGNTVVVDWFVPLPVWLPVTLALGVFGFGMLVASPTYTFYKIKEREYSSAFCWGFLMFIIGIGLVICWLWG